MRTLTEVFYTKSLYLSFVLLVLFFQSACTLNASISDLNSATNNQNLISLKVQGNITKVDVNEGATLVMIITQSAALSSDSSIQLSLEELGFSATSAFQDTFPISQVIKAGETATTVTFVTKHDPSVTGNKAFRLLVSSGNSNILGTQLDLNIIDLEINQPTLTINDMTVNEGQQALINFTLNHASTENVTLDYTTIDGTASSGTHYTPKSGNITIAAGTTSQTLTIDTTAIPAEVCASDRQLSIQITNVQKAQFSGTSPKITIKDPDRPTLSMNTPSVNENTPLVFTLTLSSVCSQHDVTFNWQTSEITATNNVDYTYSSGSGTIPKGNLNTTVSITTLNDALYESSETLRLNISNIANSSMSPNSYADGTIIDDDFGDFSISGVTSSNDSIVDAYLSNSIQPTISWSAAAGATSYDVSIYENDGTTLKCSPVNTINSSLALSSCNLTVGNNYKAVVKALSSTGFKMASNNFFSFYVNQSPTLHVSGSGPYYVMAGSSITVSALGGASPTVGIGSDPEGELLSFTSVGTPSIGSISASSSSSLTLSTASTDFGKSSISVSIEDPRGGLLTHTLEIKIVQAYTWTGALSSAWNTPGNWCGSVSADKRSCVGAGATPSGTHVIYFDNTCSSAFSCSPITTSNISVAGVRISANGFSQGTGFSLTIGTSGWTQSGGSFMGSDSAIQFSNSSLTLSSTGSFTSTSGTLSIAGGTLSFNNNFTHNNGTVALNTSTYTFTSASDFYNLSFGIWTSHAISLSSNIIVRNTLNLSGAGNLSGYQIDVYGDVSSTKTNSGTTKVRLVGNNNQSLASSGGGALPRLIIDKTGGLVTGGSTLSVLSGGIEVLNGSVDFTNTDMSLSGGGGEPIQLAGNPVKSLAINLWTAGNLVIKDNLTVINDLTLNGNGIPTPGFAGVKISTGGNLNVNLACACWGGKVNIEMTGASNSTISVGSAGGTVAGSVFGGNLIINKNPAAVVSLQSHLNMTQTGQTLVVTSGSFDMAGYNATILGLSLNSTVLTKTAGTLTVNGIVVGTGSLYGGTINP